VAARQQQRTAQGQAPTEATQQTAAQPPADSVASDQSDFDQLERLVELRRQGMLTDDEFTAAKRRLLGR
jgi:hypothetical protein